MTTVSVDDVGAGVPAGSRAGRLRPAPPPIAIALVRSLGLWAVPALVVVELVNATARDRVWAIEWQWTAYWSNASTFLVAPLVGAVAAAESILYRRRGAGALLGSDRDRLRAHLLRGGATGCWGAISHLVGVLACAASAARLHHDVRLPIGPTLPAFAAVVACGLVGAAVGWLWPSLAAPPIVVIVGVALTSLAPIAGLQQFARVDTATGSLLGLVTRPEATGADVLWWGALALVAARLMSRPEGDRTAGRWDVAALALLLLAGTAVATQSNHRFTASGRPQPVTCSATAPPLCVNAEYASRLGVYAGPAVALSQAIGRLDPADRPTRLVQSGSVVAGSPMVAGVVAVSVFPNGRADAVNLGFDLVESVSGCPRASRSPSDVLVGDEERLVVWLLADAHLPAPGLPPVADRIGSATQAATVLSGLRSEC